MIQESTSPLNGLEAWHDVLESSLLTREEVVNYYAVTTIMKEMTLVLKPFTIQQNDSHTRTLTMSPVVGVTIDPKVLVVSYPPATGIFLLGREGEPLTAETLCAGQAVTVFGNQDKDSNLFVAKVILIHSDKLL